MIGAAVTIAAVLAAATFLRTTARPSLTAASTTRLTGAATSNVATSPEVITGADETPSAAHVRWILLDGENGPASAVPARACRHLLVSAAVALGTDPVAWMVNLITQGGHDGETFDEVIHARLADAYATLDRTNHTDPEGVTKLADLRSLIADAANQPCSSTQCTPGPGGSHHRATREPASAAHAGWRWLCEP